MWRVSYPDGALERVTNDLNSYNGLSSSAGSDVVVIRNNPMSTIWTAPDGDLSRATQISSHTTDGMWGVCWTPDGRIVYSSKEAGQFDIWIMNGDGTDKKQLTANSRTNMLPAVRPDGRWIVFSSNRTGTGDYAE